MQKNYKGFIHWIVVIAILTFLCIHFIIRGNNKELLLDWETIWGDIGYSSVFVGALFILFNFAIWRIPFVGRLFHTPNINGIWEGKGKSSYKDTEYKVTIRIKQSFLQAHVHGSFDKSQSDSFSSVFVYDERTDRTVLIYSYQNNPNLEYRNKAENREEGGLNIHYGTTMLDIDYDDLTSLSGTYWNDRKYIGSIELKKREKNGK